MEEHYLVKSLMKDDFIGDDHLQLLVNKLIEEYFNKNYQRIYG
jgi:hypothetical protein